jgi:hypothetical protein
MRLSDEMARQVQPERERRVAAMLSAALAGFLLVAFACAAAAQNKPGVEVDLGVLDSLPQARPGAAPPSKPQKPPASRKNEAKPSSPKPAARKRLCAAA